MIIADSDVLIDALAGRGPATEQVRETVRAGTLATTAVSVFELESGARSPSAREALKTLLGALSVLPVDFEAASAAARIRREFESRGEPIGMADYLIAGVCLARKAALLTRKREHFDRVPGLRLA